MANKKRRAEELEKKNTKKPITKSFMIKLTAISVAVLFFLVCTGMVINSYAPANPKDYHVWCLSGISGSFNKKGNPETYWQVEKSQLGNKNVVTYAHVQIEGSWADIKTVWVNISDLYEKELEIEIQSGTGQKTIKKHVITAEELKKSKDGWIKIYDLSQANASTSDSYDKITANVIYFGFNTKINVREIVFVNASGKIIEYDIKGIKKDTLEIPFETEEVSGAEVVNGVANINDENETFKK